MRAGLKINFYARARDKHLTCSNPLKRMQVDAE